MRPPGGEAETGTREISGRRMAARAEIQAVDREEAKADRLRVAIQVEQTELDAHSYVIYVLVHRISVTEDLGRQRGASLVTARSDQTAAQTKLLAEFKEISHFSRRFKNTYKSGLFQ